MVRIINYKKRMSEEKEFFVLEVSGGIEMVQSKTTGQYYATSTKAFIASTFDEDTCKALVGTEFPGSVIKQKCEPYEYSIKETGEIITLSHRYVYLPEETKQQAKPTFQEFQPNMEEFSQNGKFAIAD